MCRHQMSQSTESFHSTEHQQNTHMLSIIREKYQIVNVLLPFNMEAHTSRPMRSTVQEITIVCKNPGVIALENIDAGILGLSENNITSNILE